jgi:hypothetical protein
MRSTTALPPCPFPNVDRLRNVHPYLAMTRFIAATRSRKPASAAAAERSRAAQRSIDC